MNYSVSFRFGQFRFDLFRFVSISFRFCKFRFVSMHFVSIYFVSFRFVSFRFRFAFYRYPIKCGIRRVWRYQMGNQNPYIEEEQTTQWPKEKAQKDKQRPTKHTHKTKDWVTRTPLKTGDVLRCSERVSSSCSTGDTRRVNLVTNPLISHEWGKDRKVFTTSGTYPWSFVTQIL